MRAWQGSSAIPLYLHACSRSTCRAPTKRCTPSYVTAASNSPPLPANPSCCAACGDRAGRPAAGQPECLLSFGRALAGPGQLQAAGGTAPIRTACPADLRLGPTGRPCLRAARAPKTPACSLSTRIHIPHKHDLLPLTNTRSFQSRLPVRCSHLCCDWSVPLITCVETEGLNSRLGSNSTHSLRRPGKSRESAGSEPALPGRTAVHRRTIDGARHPAQRAHASVQGCIQCQ